jgi:D-arabinan exo alpha-(1,3)/(1,5)-arabinofuranosidase (non-reducing end)
MKNTILAMLYFFVFPVVAFGQSVGVAFYEDLGALPILYPNVQSYYLSSYDRTGGNDDGFRGTYSQLYIEENGEHVIFDEKGPGCVYNFWFTGSGRKLHWGKLRFYFDEEKNARFTCEAMEFFRGRTKPFVTLLVTHAYQSSGGYSCAAPIPFAKRLKITTEKTVGFYNVYYQLYKDIPVTTWTPEIDYTSVIQLFQTCSSDPKRVGEVTAVEKTVALAAARGRVRPEDELLALNQKGTIQYIKINPLYKPNTYSLNHMYLRIFYDQQDKAAVEAPLGPFFGSGLGEADMRGMFAGMSSSGTYYCYFPMPFREGIRITLQNRNHDDGGAFFCEIGYNNLYPTAKQGAKVGYFGAKYNQAWPIVEEKDYVLFDFQGEGAIAGQVMTVEPVKADRKRWWEGDMRIHIDGETKPRFHGTGHEDEYQGGWSTFWLTNPYSLPLFGQPKTENLIDVFGQVNGSTTAYRFWPGKIPFQKSIRISTEHGNHNDTPANYSSLVYYYYVP